MATLSISLNMACRIDYHDTQYKYFLHTVMELPQRHYGMQDADR